MIEGTISVRRTEGNMMLLNIVENIATNYKNQISANTSHKFAIQHYSQREQLKIGGLANNRFVQYTSTVKY